MKKDIYTQVLLEKFKESKDNLSEFEDFYKKMIALLHSKNLSSLVPEIILDLEKKLQNIEKNTKTILTVTDTSDVEKFSEEIMKTTFDIQNIEIKEDLNISGGFILQDSENILDNSYKTKLLTMYKNIITS